MSFSSPVTFSVPPPNHSSILCPIISCRVSDILETFVPTTLYQILGLEQQHGHQIIFIKKKRTKIPQFTIFVQKNLLLYVTKCPLCFSLL